MVKGLVKRCSTQLIIREIQNKTAMKHHLTSVRMAIIKKSTNKCWSEYGEKGTLLHCWWECKLVKPLWRKYGVSFKKLKVELPYDSPIPLLDIHTEKTIIQKDTCTPLQHYLQQKRQPKCPLTNKQIKLWYIYAMAH